MRKMEEKSFENGKGRMVRMQQVGYSSTSPPTERNVPVLTFVKSHHRMLLKPFS